MNTRLDRAVELPVLGITTCFTTNSASVATLIDEAFGEWRGTVPLSDVRLRVNIAVHDGSEGADVPAHVRYLSTDSNRLLAHSPGSMAVADARRGESVAYVTEELVADRDHFRTTFLEAMVFALLAPFDRHPVHAAALVQADRTVLLAGPSGTGKSTIAYLAHTAGLGVLSDEMVWVQMRPTLRIWASGACARLGPDARLHFPELAVAAPLPGTDPLRKTTIRLDATARPLRDASTSAVVCVLARGSRAALERLEAPAVVADLTRQLAGGFDRFPERQDAVFAALALGGGWRLTLSDNPHDALPYLKRMLESL